MSPHTHDSAHFSLSQHKHTHVHTFPPCQPSLLVSAMSLAGELVKGPDTSSKVQPSRKDSHWAWRCSLGFTGLLSNYSTALSPCFFPHGNHTSFFCSLAGLSSFLKTFIFKFEAKLKLVVAVKSSALWVSFGGVGGQSAKRPSKSNLWRNLLDFNPIEALLAGY